MRVVRRAGNEPEHNFVETVSGDAPSSVEISQTARGIYTYALKLYYSDPETLLAQARQDIATFDAQFKALFPATPKT